MRLGILSDIHANYEALSAVVEAFKREEIDKYYCLGDTVGYGGSPNECADIVRNLVEATILGNHDAAVAGRMDYSYYYEAARHALDTHAQMLSDENMQWLKVLPYQLKFDEIGVHLCHGSPVRLEEFEYIFAPEQARECLPMFEELGHITLIGHSHLCKVFALTKTTVEELPPSDGLTWLSAKPKAADSGLQSARIGFNNGTLDKLSFIDNFGQQTVVSISRFEKNPALPADTFRFTPPKGADVIGG